MLVLEIIYEPPVKVQAEEILFQPVGNRLQTTQLLYWQQQIVVEGTYGKLEEAEDLRAILEDLGCMNIQLARKGQPIQRYNLFEITGTGTRLSVTRPAIKHEIRRGALTRS